MLHAAAEKAGSQLALAERLGVSESVLSLWLSGKRRPNLANAVMLSERIKIPFRAWREEAGDAT